MFGHTKELLSKTLKIAKTLFFLISLITQFIYITYLIYAVSVKTGSQFLNIALLILSVLYTLFYTVVFLKRNKPSKTVKRAVKRGYKWGKLIIKAINLGIAIYGLFNITKGAVLSVILTVLMLLFWTIQVVFEIVLFYIEKKFAVFMREVRNDIQAFTLKKDKELQ